MPAIQKARYWNAVLYPENMISGWEEEVADILQVPFAYCIHDKDTTKSGDERKVHVHFIAVFSNTTTYKHAYAVFDTLSAPDKSCLNKIEACIDIRHSYDYLIHDTANCRKKKKHLYDKSDRITGNNFDIGDYEQLSQADKDDMLKELCDYVIEKKFLDMRDCYINVMANFDKRYFAIYKSNNALLDRLVRGNYNNKERKKIEQSERCPICGGKDDLEIVEYINGKRIHVCKDHKDLVLKLIDEQLESGLFDSIL